MGGGWREDCSFVPLFELLNRFTRTEAHDFDFDFTRIIIMGKVCSCLYKVCSCLIV